MCLLHIPREYAHVNRSDFWTSASASETKWNGPIYILLLQIKAEIVCQTRKDYLNKLILDWLEQHKIKNFCLNLNWCQENPIWKGSAPVSCGDSITVFGGVTPPTSLLRNFTDKQLSDYIVTINQSDRSFMFAGFMSRPLHNLIKSLGLKHMKKMNIT